MRRIQMDTGQDHRWKIARGFARFIIGLVFEVFLSETATVPVTSGQVHDIGLGGLAGSLESDVRIGQRVWLEFRLPPSAEPIRLLARVCHSESGRFGFEFLSITAEQRDLIRGACQGLPTA